MNETFHTGILSTEFGDFAVAVDSDGALAAIALGGETTLAQYLPGDSLVRDERRAAPALAALKDWLAGSSAPAIALAPRGTPFRQQVWAELLKIPHGQTRTYGEIAQTVGGSPRGVGSAVGANPIPLLIPCHRVIGADGSLTGFALGLELKRRLLEREGALLKL